MSYCLTVASIIFTSVQYDVGNFVKSQVRIFHDALWVKRANQRNMHKIESVLHSEGGPTFTISQAVEHLGHGKFQLIVAGYAGFVVMADAMEMMILSVLLPSLACEWDITNLQQAFIATSVFAGMAASSGLWGRFCDRNGRRLGLILMSIITFVFGMASAFSPNYYVFLLLRMLTGVGIGGMPQSTTYFSEFLPVRHRALCILLFYTFWSLGSAFEAIVALVIIEPYGWRMLLIISTIPLAIAAILCWFMPETPRFLLTSGKHEEAYKTLQLMGRLNGRTMPPGKLIDRKSELDEDLGQFSDLLSRKMLLTTILVWFIWFASIFCYYGLILLTTVIFQNDMHAEECLQIPYYPNNNTSAFTQSFTTTPKPPTTCKKLRHEDYTYMAYTSMSEFPGLLVCAMMFQLWGRKVTMSVEFGIFSVFVFLLLFCVKRSWSAVFLFIARSAINGVFSSVFIYTPEVYPTMMRAVGMGWASGMGRIGAVLTPYFAEELGKRSISVPIYVYGGAGVLAAIAPLFLPLETRGRRMRDRLSEENESSIDGSDAQ